MTSHFDIGVPASPGSSDPRDEGAGVAFEHANAPSGVSSGRAEEGGKDEEESLEVKKKEKEPKPEILKMGGSSNPAEILVTFSC